MKRYISEMVNSLTEAKKASGWKVETINKYVAAHKTGLISEWELVQKIVEILDQGAKITYRELDTAAKANCVNQFLNVVCPYDVTGDLDGATLDEIGENVDYWISDQYWFDESGDWYEEGNKLAR